VSLTSLCFLPFQRAEPGRGVPAKDGVGRQAAQGRQSQQQLYQWVRLGRAHGLEWEQTGHRARFEWDGGRRQGPRFAVQPTSVEAIHVKLRDSGGNWRGLALEAWLLLEEAPACTSTRDNFEIYDEDNKNLYWSPYFITL